MSRRDTTLDPQVAAELAQLDAALSGARIDDRELEELVRGVRELVPAIDPVFVERLGERVASGFDDQRGTRRPRFALPWRRRASEGRSRRRAGLVPALGVIASLALVVVVVGALGGFDQSSESKNTRELVGAPDVSSSDGSAAARPQGDSSGGPADAREPGVAAGDEDAVIEPVPPDFEVPGAEGRMVELSAQLALSTDRDSLRKVVDGILRATRDVDGYVATSRVASGDSGGDAVLRLRVPVDRLDEAVGRISSLASVESLAQSSSDVTALHESTRERLEDARAERRALLRALDETNDPIEIERLRQQLREARRLIAALEQQLRAVRQRAELATIDVSVATAVERDDEGGAWTPGDALDDALRVLEVSAAVVLVALAAAVPLALVIGAALLATRSVRKRRREAALDGA